MSIPSPSSTTGGSTRRVGPGRPRKHLQLLCRHCKREFMKAEHLLRHERSHTKEKPFQCLTCDKAFVRQDSLARHMKLHEEHGAPDDGPTPQGEDDPFSVVPDLDQDLASHHSQDLHDESTHIVFDANHDPFAPDPSYDYSMLDATAMTCQLPNGVPQASTYSENSMTVADNNEPDLWQLLFNDLLPGAGSLQTSSHFLESLGLANDPLFAAFAPASIQPGNLAGPSGTYAPFALNRSDHINGQSQAVIGVGLSRVRAQDDEGLFDKETGRSQEAVTEVRSLVSNLSSRVTAAVSPLSNSWLRLCLQMFWNRFIPSFPIMNRHTFDIHSTCAPLLLNMVAIGTLSLHGQDDRVKGITLWRLVHKAVAGSWDGLMEHQAQYEPCKGVQLLQTALLGQIFAMMSESPDLASTAEIFHGLGFRWAKLAGISAESCLDSELTASGSVTLDTRWRAWTARENLKRAILGHYILDGCLSSMTRSSPTNRHTSNPFDTASDDRSYQAESAELWYNLYRQSPPQRSFRDIYNDLFDRSHPQPLDQNIGTFSRQVILEGLLTLVVEWSEARGGGVGTVQLSEISMALSRFYQAFLENNGSSPLLARWHHIGIIASEAVIAQKRDYTGDPDWVQLDTTPAGRRSILHALAITKVVDTIPIASRIMILFVLPAVVHSAAITLCRHVRSHRALHVVGDSSMMIDVDKPIDWSGLGNHGLTSGNIEPTLEPAFLFIQQGGSILQNGSLFSVHDLHPLITVLTVFGQIWPKARTYAEDIKTRIGMLDASS